MSSGASVAINGWGCESASPTSKYVASVATTANGVITVLAQNFNDADIDGDGVVMTPYADTGMTDTMDTTNDAGKQVAAWRCAPSATSIAKYLPGSCK